MQDSYSAKITAPDEEEDAQAAEYEEDDRKIKDVEDAVSAHDRIIRPLSAMSLTTVIECWSLLRVPVVRVARRR